MDEGKSLGEFLRARRELVRPQDVGLPAMGRRRVPGLRREELAMLAGISIDYCVRLEQGRDQHPSEQVLEALAQALRLDEDATAHLYRLARPAVRRRARRKPERVPAGIQQLVMSWAGTPAYVQSRHLDVLLANPLATALSPIYARGVNQLRAAFLDPAVRDLYRDWEKITASTVAGLRALAGDETHDPRVAELVGELSVCSERFRRLWARRDGKAKCSGSFHLDHPQVGPLELRYEKLAVVGTDGQVLVVHHAEPGSISEQGLALLSGLTGGPRHIEWSRQANSEG
ncbi:helix-turn-helix transcriptional regulator [Planotetraspora phitsanulokensis]|uniref:Transcriptional regulator n=1 Tax=Planotetraspora phitsanulokensis TaxID=575192 RepID=A0A8J3U3Z2_9ACTN|nr:helix-turn-helix transcriptional regulator [Planotetraspora phitsanulokensis]GII36796.1 transcriptional regulator [Planotetraspora phitsanulokensis]